MLQDIRDNSQGTIAKIIVIAVIVSLALFGVEAIVGGFTGEPTVATVNGDEITEREFQRSVQMRRQQALQEMERPDPALLDEGAINQEVLESLISQALIYKDAKDRGVDLSEAEIDQLITGIPAFQVDNQFNRERFRSLVRNQGMGVQEFRDALRRDYVMRQIQSVISAGAFAHPETAKDLLALQQQRRAIATLNLDESLVAEDVTISDDEVESFYADKGELFTRPESIDVAWIALDRDAIKAELDVPDDNVRALYEQRKASMEAQEERSSAHILLEPEAGDEVDPARIAEVEDALERGEDFAEVARRLSDDPGSAGSGGELGFATRDSYDEAFADALFAIEAKGEVAGPVESPYGIHFIKLLEIREQAGPDFAEIQDELRDELAGERANELYNRRSDRLADIAFSAFDLEEPAAEVGVEVQQADNIKREGNEAPFDHSGLIRQLFAEDVLEDGNNTELVEVDDGFAVVARVTEHYPEQRLPLDEVRSHIRERLTRNKLREALDQLASEWVAALEAGEDPAVIAAKAGTAWTPVSMVERDSRDVPAPVLDAVFRLPRPEGGAVYGSAGTGAGITLIQLNQVENPSIEDEDPTIEAVQRFIAQQQGGQASRLYLEALREKATIERQ